MGGDEEPGEAGDVREAESSEPRDGAPASGRGSNLSREDRRKGGERSSRQQDRRASGQFAGKRPERR